MIDEKIRPEDRRATLPLHAAKPWERFSGEPAGAYQQFLAFRGLGPGRTIDAAFWSLVGEQPGSKQGAKRASGRFFATASRFRWVGRAQAWDDHLQSKRDLVAAREAAKWELRRIQALDEAWSMAQSLRAKVRKMLEWPLSVQRISKDGQTVEIHPARWNFGTAALMARTIIELEAACLTAMTRPIEQYSRVELDAIEAAGLEFLKGELGEEGAAR